MAVYVLDKHKQPLMPCSEKRARLLLTKQKAVVHKMYPFTIRLKDRVGGNLQPILLKIDPGSKHTGIALVRLKKDADNNVEHHVLNLIQLNHRGYQISINLHKRAGYRRLRRSKLRYRPVRYLNRKASKPKGWLAPSIIHRVESTINSVNKLQKLCPIKGISVEHVKFDAQKMMNLEIQGVEYQQGTLFGLEVKEYILEKFNRTCVYCGVQNVPLEVEHLHPKSKGGSNRVSNLALACVPCNRRKDNTDVKQFLKKKPKLLKKILKQVKEPLKDAAVVNTTRNKLAEVLEATGLRFRKSTGARTKLNRKRLRLPKTHALDAACVGSVHSLHNSNVPTLNVTCMGRGQYRRTIVDANGFPRGYFMKQKKIKGFQTGDIVKAVVTRGKKIGIYVGRVAIRASGSFNISTKEGTIQGIGHKYMKIIQQNDGYDYSWL